MYVEDLKFSLWCDFVERSFLDGEFVELIEKGIVNGATSNPAIFKSAILTSKAYKDDIKVLAGKSPKEKYEILATKDIKKAADKLLPLYKKEDDGFISLEVDPFLCDDTKATIEEGKRLFAKIGMPNVMIKVPATSAGYEAMTALVSEGINVNATLIFSTKQTKKCLEAFKKGKELYKGNHLPKAVISVFVSRFDRKLDKKLEELDLPTGKVGIYNAIKVYEMIESYGLDNVRTLFASTGVKGDGLEADYYIKGLLLKNSINTAPLNTIKHFVKSGKNSDGTKIDEDINIFLTKINDKGIKLDEVCDDLMKEGIKSFKDAFSEILDALK